MPDAIPISWAPHEVPTIRKTISSSGRIQPAEMNAHPASTSRPSTVVGRLIMTAWVFASEVSCCHRSTTSPIRFSVSGRSTTALGPKTRAWSIVLRKVCACPEARAEVRCTRAFLSASRREIRIITNRNTTSGSSSTRASRHCTANR